MPGDDRMRDGEPESRPSPLLGGEERLEDALLELGRDAASGVADLDVDAPVRVARVRTSICPGPSIACIALASRFMSSWSISLALQCGPGGQCRSRARS